MKEHKFNTVLLTLAVIFVLVAGACTPATPATPAAPVAPTAKALPAEIVVGVVQPLTGSFA
ncbi:MAG: ABC transporter substrate-binding protein, partial [Chloroflexi bacterium]|nr:ABC transporter substrate-binding protein [Chloroflexota bacterium]